MKNKAGRHLARLLTVAGILFILCGTAAALWIELSPEEKAVLRNILDEHPALILSAAFLFPFAAVLGSLWVFRHFIEPLGRLADDVHLMNLVNPSHRLAVEGSAQIRGLSLAINRALDRIQDLQTHVGDAVEISRRKAEEEKAVLEALIQDFPDGVIVCNAEGQILLYNRRARDVLTPGERPPDSASPLRAYVGLGRSVFGFIDRDLIVHALEMIDRGLKGGNQRADARFVTKGPGGRLLRVATTPVVADPPEIRGYILIIRDISAETGRDLRRESLLESLTERLRSSLATVRTAIEILVDHPSMEASQRDLLTRVIRDESFSLSGYLESRREEHAEYFGRQWPLEEMLAGDVAAAVRQAAEQGLDVRMTLLPASDQILVRADSFTLVQALVYLTSSVKKATGGLEYAINAARHATLASIDILWRGKPLPAATLREWEESRIRIAGEEIPVTLAEVLKRHDAELWSGEDPDGARAYLRVLLPSPGRGGEKSSWQAYTPVKSRPEFYDFDLFSIPSRSLPLGGLPLAEIPCTAFDTETTGLRPSGGDEVIAIGAVRILNGRMLREEVFDQIVDPGRPIGRESTDVHGIDDSMVEGQPGIADVLPAFSRFAQETVLVGHNAAFDMRFFQIKEEATGVRLRMPVLDTMLLSAVVHPHHDDHSIEGIAARVGVNITGRHTALGDAIVTGELFLKLIPLLADKGIRTLGEAVAASKETYLARVRY
ncbi:MAG TPA: exonuclease domain-containing protein [Bacteroidota bacterium]|nr:exonuclease domain-containing protein [Bacteroidota bacterium]